MEVAGQSLIDHCLDRLEAAGVSKVVVNVHYLAELVEVHLAKRERLKIEISDERNELLETGGGVLNALPLLGKEPFIFLNSDSIWIEGVRPNLEVLSEFWDGSRMDMLLMLAPTVNSVGYSGLGDFELDKIGQLRRRLERMVSPFVYSGVGIAHPRCFAKISAGKFSLNKIFDLLIEKNRLFGLQMDGVWVHVGKPEVIPLANRVMLGKNA